MIGDLRAVGAGALLLLAPSLAAQDRMVPEEGEPFPEIAFPTLDGGGLATMKEFRGRKILLMQFASW